MAHMICNPQYNICYGEWKRVNYDGRKKHALKDNKDGWNSFLMEFGQLGEKLIEEASFLSELFFFPPWLFQMMFQIGVILI